MPACGDWARSRSSNFDKNTLSPTSDSANVNGRVLRPALNCSSASRPSFTRVTSGRATAMIDPETRDIVQTIYVRRVEKKNNELWNAEFEKFENVKDPGKAQ